jgi:hypothetical protein
MKKFRYNSDDEIKQTTFINLFSGGIFRTFNGYIHDIHSFLSSLEVGNNVYLSSDEKFGLETVFYFMQSISRELGIHIKWQDPEPIIYLDPPFKHLSMLVPVTRRWGLVGLVLARSVPVEDAA